KELPEAQSLRASRRALIKLAFLLSILVAAYLVVEVVSWRPASDFINWAGPVSLAVGCLWAASKMAAANRLLLLTPVPWFLAASATYFGVGPLSYTFGGEEAVAYMN